MSATLPSAEISEKPARVQPTFLGALRGVWLLTWKSQVTWRRLSAAGLGLIALPVLVFLTTPSPASWAETHRLQMGAPAIYLSGFNRRVARAGAPLQPAQQAELSRIVSEEFARTERDWAKSGATEDVAELQRNLRQQCDERILDRVQTVLEQRQLAEFQAYQRRNRGQRTAQPGELVWGRTAPFYHCLIDLYFFIILPLNCVRMCGALIRDELEADTLSFLTTRPLSRARLLLSKFLSQTAWLQIWFLAQALILFAAGALRSIPDLAHLVPLFLGVQILAVVVWSALGLFLGQISKRYMALALVYGFIVELGIGRIPTNINSLSMMRHLQTLLGHNAVLQNMFNWPAANISSPVSAIILAAVFFLILAATLFTFLEYHHTNEMQK